MTWKSTICYLFFFYKYKHYFVSRPHERKFILDKNKIIFILEILHVTCPNHDLIAVDCDLGLEIQLTWTANRMNLLIMADTESPMTIVMTQPRGVYQRKDRL